MAILPILVAPHPNLRKQAEPVAVVDATIRELLKDMEDTMRAEDGIGLAAPQIGVSKRIFVMHLPPNIGVDGHLIAGLAEKPDLFFIINPEIISKSEEKSVCQEGCLSIPEQYAAVTRPATVVLRYLNENGETLVQEFKHYQAACVQHEIDHLNGKLFVDYLSTLKRDILIRKAHKAVQNARN